MGKLANFQLCEPSTVEAHLRVSDLTNDQGQWSLERLSHILPADVISRILDMPLPILREEQIVLLGDFVMMGSSLINLRTNPY